MLFTYTYNHQTHTCITACAIIYVSDIYILVYSYFTSHSTVVKFQLMNYKHNQNMNKKVSGIEWYWILRLPLKIDLLKRSIHKEHKFTIQVLSQMLFHFQVVKIETITHQQMTQIESYFSNSLATYAPPSFRK